MYKRQAADYVEYLEITAVEIEKSGDYVTALDAKTGDCLLYTSRSREQSFTCSAFSN